MHEQGKLTDEEVAYLDENDIITIGGITVDFSALGGEDDNYLEPQEVPADFWIASANGVAYINTKYINFPGNAWAYGDQTIDQPGECKKTRLVVPPIINGIVINDVDISNVDNIVFIDISKIQMQNLSCGRKRSLG
ncbi:MAG: hypothetical protein IJ629_05200 [Clostridia bacterium]|nr:hypothetical protein [Clostridia bacterium]